MEELTLEDILKRAFIILGSETQKTDYYKEDLEIRIDTEMIKIKTKMLLYLPELKFGTKKLLLRGNKAQLLDKRQKETRQRYNQNEYDYWKSEEMDDGWIKWHLDITDKELKYYKEHYRYRRE